MHGGRRRERSSLDAWDAKLEGWQTNLNGIADDFKAWEKRLDDKIDVDAAEIFSGERVPVDQKYAGLHSELDKFEGRLNSYENDINGRIQNKYEAGIRAEKPGVEADLREARSDKARSEEQLRNAEAEKSQAQSQYASAERSRDRARNRLRNAESDESSLRSRISSLNSRISSLQSQLCSTHKFQRFLLNPFCLGK